MEVFILSGSIGKTSHTRTLLCYIKDLLIAKNLKTTFWDLGEKPLPIAIPEFHNRPEDNPIRQVRNYIGCLQRADAIVLGSPLYHGSYSGVLKNALDNLPSNAFLRKPVALVSHSSNTRSCVTPCKDLRPVVRSLRGYATHAHIGTSDGDYTFSNGAIILDNQQIKLRAEKLITELLALATALREMPPLMH